MEFGQSLSVLNACVVLGLTILTPLAGYPRQPGEANSETTVPSENYDRRNHLIEKGAEPPDPGALKSEKEGRVEEAPRNPVLPPGFASMNLLSFANSKKPTLVEKTYLDAFTILKEDNTCSRFYGGPFAIKALNDLVRGLENSYLDKDIAIRMSGGTSSVLDAATGGRYRIFNKVQLNLNGPFYKGNLSLYESKIPLIGYFQPNTREARVTILLHELGHLLPTPDKQWVLPNDGGDPELSRKNTSRVIGVCRDQISALSHLSFDQELVAAREPSPQDPADEFARR